jgi:hypothetical protein
VERVGRQGRRKLVASLGNGYFPESSEDSLQKVGLESLLVGSADVKFFTIVPTTLEAILDHR